MHKETILQELRQLFRDGATPSRLVRHILARHPDEDVSHWMLRDYLAEAFGLDLVRFLKADSDYSLDNLNLAFLNRILIPEILEQRAVWDNSAEESSCWFDGLDATSPATNKAEAKATPLPGVSEESWTNLTPEDQEAIHVMMATGKTLSQRVKILAVLAERLQQQVEQLEAQLRDSKIPQS